MGCCCCFLSLWEAHTTHSPPLHSLLTTPTNLNLHPKFRCRFSPRTKWDREPVRATPFDFDSEFRFPRRKRVKRRNWWSDDDDDDEEDDDEGYNRTGFGLWDEPNAFGWIFEVLKSFGWMVPAVIMSALMGTEPNHSLIMAMALPLGQTALSLVFEGLWGRSSRSYQKPGSRSRTKRKPRPRSERNSFVRNPSGAQPRKNSRGRGTQTGREGYRSWEAANIGSAKKVAKSESRFGGWDELLDEPAAGSNSFLKDCKNGSSVNAESDRLSAGE